MDSLYMLVLVLSAINGSGQTVTNMVTINNFADEATCMRQLTALKARVPDGFVVEFEDCTRQTNDPSA